MRKIIKWVGITVLTFVVVFVVGGSLISPRFIVTRNALVGAPAEKVYALVADPRGWATWSVWNQRDPAMQVSYSGPASGAGAKWQWKSKSQGDGAMTFTAAEPPKRVAFELFFADFNTTSQGEFTFVPEGPGTRVTWTMNGDMGSNPAFHWLALFGDKMIGKDFEDGLAGLKRVAEAR